MGKTYRPWDPDQHYLLPPSVRDWLPENDLVYFILDTVNALDISAITEKYEREQRGFPPYHPRMMTALLIYAYCRGVYSSRRIMQACEERITFRVIAGEDIPNFRTISDFRKLHLKALEALFVQVLRICQKAGLVTLGHIALDGTKVKANASRHKAMSYGRMKQEEERLKEEIRRLLEEAEALDREEDAAYGAERRGDELPEELGRRQRRLKRIQEAKRALEEEARAAAEHERKEREDESRDDDGPKRGRKRKAVSEVPDDTKQYNFTDPESGIMKANNKGWDQCGNAQVAVDGEGQVIVAYDVTNESNDKKQLAPMVEKARESVGADRRIKKLSADSGYYSESNVRYVQGKGIDAYIATRKLKHTERLAKAPRGRPPSNLTVKERMARKLRTRKGRRIYSRRKSIVEPVFGQVKRARAFIQFSMRGIEKMRGEWGLVCLTHNLLKVFRAKEAVVA